MFGGAAHQPTFGRISEALGPTYPGEVHAGQYPLQYPGIAFLFPLPAVAAQQQRHQQGPVAGSGVSSELPVALSTPAARIILHHGSAASLAAARGAPPPPAPRAAAGGSSSWRYFEPVAAVPCQGLLLGGGAAGGSCRVLRFGASPQDVVSELGEPSSTHARPRSYLYCYASRGLDALFCGTTHRLRKLVLHANQPGHPDFGIYSKCNFRWVGGAWCVWHACNCRQAQLCSS